MEPKTENNTSLQNARDAVQLCNVAIDTNPVKNIGTLMPGWKIVWNGGQVTDPNYAFVAIDVTGQKYALAIRGSVVPSDVFNQWDVFVDWVLEDLDVALAYWPFASTAMPCISAGAYVAFTSLLLMQDTMGSGQSLADFLITHTAKQGKELIITGHSLGGNMANVYASYYAETLKRKGLPLNNISLFTFAAPAPGNSDFAKDLDAKLPTAYHYQNLNDVVPYFPVAEGLAATGNLYNPHPAASAIKVTFNHKQITLQSAFQLLGELFLLAGYQQPKKNYITFTAKLFPELEKDNIQDWLGQAGFQHQLFNYANYLGVTLPAHAKKPVAQTV
ncbi:MAG: hypothetical protein JO154_21910 [Chitinophaga sp.]|uniref:lipase family protein n=1 Tax=Chitinophaga sp. TaxID=1869181 RepID=UPI0025BE0D39|nr:hypothetical protein [Chitinophaga sp.]MBV8255271.1 hypothetical protein [Chitinophaga sp.]